MAGRLTAAATTAVVTGCGLMLGGCGGSGSSSAGGGGSGGSGGSGGTTVTLSLVGSRGNLNAVACGHQEAFYQFPAPARVSFTGTVSPAPSGRWKVKAKLKRCSGSTYVDVTSQKLVGQPSGRFDGVFGVPQRGAYSVRARLESGGRPQSAKVYLQVG